MTSSEKSFKPIDATLCFLVRRDSNNEIESICLAMKKRGFGEGRWNGVGGKVDAKINETVEEALSRETEEEIEVTIQDYLRVGYIVFKWPDKEMNVHVFLCERWM